MGAVAHGAMVVVLAWTMVALGAAPSWFGWAAVAFVVVVPVLVALGRSALARIWGL